ncbi:MAG: hypothetical protein ACLRRT_03230 [Ruthenibacterium lactatiformans]
MELQHKPRLGILALMLEGYEPCFRASWPASTNMSEVIASLSGTADFVFPRIAASREAIEALTAQYNAEGLDGILILMLSYSQGQYLVHAMQRNTLPLALALVHRMRPWATISRNGAHSESGHPRLTGQRQLPDAGRHPLRILRGQPQNGELAAFAADFGAAAHGMRAAADEDRNHRQAGRHGRRYHR